MGSLSESRTRLITCFLLARLASSSSLKVLFVGNSYTYFNGGLDQVRYKDPCCFSNTVPSQSKCSAPSRNFLVCLNTAPSQSTCSAPSRKFLVFSAYTAMEKSFIPGTVATVNAMVVRVHQLSNRRSPNAELPAWRATAKPPVHFLRHGPFRFAGLFMSM